MACVIDPPLSPSPPQAAPPPSGRERIPEGVPVEGKDWLGCEVKEV